MSKWRIEFYLLERDSFTPALSIEDELLCGLEEWTQQEQSLLREAAANLSSFAEPSETLCVEEWNEPIDEEGERP